MEKEQLVLLINEIISHNNPYELSILEIKFEDNFWYVTLNGNWPERLYDSYNLLAEIEIELENKFDINILLIPKR